MCLVKPYPEIRHDSGGIRAVPHFPSLPGQALVSFGPRSHHRVNVWSKGCGVLRRVRRKLREVGRRFELLRDMGPCCPVAHTVGTAMRWLFLGDRDARL